MYYYAFYITLYIMHYMQKYILCIILICCYIIYREEAPPGYIKGIVTKVVNNITINCNNLILKYVEEDIVLSVNVRFLSMQTVNNKWEPAFTGIYLILKIIFLPILKLYSYI